ncbi:NfeD family protein [Ciceribacter sp. L1K22]|uniref:NfeD family protein n=1 Tax=Ciceribacter sp. L1K22 TaxID=2820275 RepID=UPI001ABEC12C|nr:NfeD family protein [Ciceribacter sp. L1K22]MBO3761849.1 NfeD family protein [Ciceribacter sp. L1K22]
MLDRLIGELGPWSWWILALILLGAELALPGVFLVWIGIAALLTGILSLILWESAGWVWQLQLVVFALLALTAALVGRRYFSRSEQASDEPLLNQRTASLVGRTATLHEPITDGRGRVRLDDTYWSVMGPDMPAGSRVRIIESRGRELRVERQPD